MSPCSTISVADFTFTLFKLYCFISSHNVQRTLMKIMMRKAHSCTHVYVCSIGVSTCDYLALYLIKLKHSLNASTNLLCPFYFFSYVVCAAWVCLDMCCMYVHWIFTYFCSLHGLLPNFVWDMACLSLFELKNNKINEWKRLDNHFLNPLNTGICTFF